MMRLETIERRLAESRLEFDRLRESGQISGEQQELWTSIAEDVVSTMRRKRENRKTKNPPGWRNDWILFKTVEGPEVRIRAAVRGPFAVRQSLDGRYVLMHIRSSVVIAQFDLRKQAFELARQIECLDWDFDDRQSIPVFTAKAAVATVERFESEIEARGESWR